MCTKQMVFVSIVVRVLTYIFFLNLNPRKLDNCGIGRVRVCRKFHLFIRELLFFHPKY